MKDCCEKCVGDSFESVMGESYCTNSVCDCHSSPSWEERFDEAFLGAMGRDGQDGYSEEREEIATFIKKLLHERTEEIIGEIENMKEKTPKIISDLTQTTGYQYALNKAIDALRKKYLD